MTARMALSRVATGLLALVVGTPAFGMAQGLKVCLEQGAAPLSSPEHQGMDTVAATLVAEWLGRALEIVWYEGEDDEEASSAAQVNALLAAGLCQIAGGYPLVADGLRTPFAAEFPLEFPDGSRRFVTLGKPIHTLPYRAFGYRVILAPPRQDKTVSRLGDLSGMRILAEQNSLADNLLLSHDGGALRADVVHVPMLDEAGVLGALVGGRGDAALIEGPQFEALKLANPSTALRDSGYQHPLMINVGFVALETQRALVDLFDEAIEDLLAEGDLEAAIQELGYRYQAPVEPQVLPPLTYKLLAQP